MKITFLLCCLQILVGCNCSNKNSATNSVVTVITNDPISDYRPSFHFAPAINWTNDPNGLVFYQGQYHLFYQYNPFGTKWGHMSWGHATSTDLLNWKHLPVAIPEYTNPDHSVTGVFSGTAVVDSFNTSGFGTLANQMPLVVIYTSNVDGIAQHQSLAYSTDGINFTRYAGNPILEMQSKEFRDPKIFWHSQYHKWVMIVSKPDIKKVRFYSSANLKDWEFMSDFGAIGNTDRVWECPDMFELAVNNTGEKKWVITNSAGHPQTGYLAMQYFIGNFDGTRFTADPLNYPMYVDYGKDFYAGIIYNNLPSSDGRKIMIGWANCWEYANDIPTTGFRGMMAIPRELKLVKTPDNRYLLAQLPVAETNKYRGELLFKQDSLSVQNSTLTAGNARGNKLDIEFTMKTGDAGQSGIKVFKTGEEETTIYFDKTDHHIKLDRTKSGNTTFSKRFSSIESVEVPKGNFAIKFRILTDNSLVEVFINDGERVITDQVFPLKLNGSVEFFSTGGKTDFSSVKIYKMNGSLVSP